ncbi:MAG: TolC family protein [Campylobacteraceae bacterium]|nr:TolC family protein [Campylobacteraceae bacterium]
MTSFLKNILIFSLFSNILLANELNIEDLISIALKNNTNIKIEKYTKEEKQADIKSSESLYLPKLNAKADLSSYDINQGGNKIKDNKVKSYSLSANQLIYDFGLSSYKIDLSKHNYNASSKSLLIIIQKTIKDVKNSYYQILKKQELIKVAIESLNLDKLNLDKVKAYVKAGIKTKIDLTNAKLSLSNSNLDLIKAKYSLKQSYVKLITILGTNQKYLIKSQDFELNDLKKNVTKLSRDLGYYVKNGLTNRIEIKRYEDLIKINQASIDSAKAQYYPRIDFNATYSNNNSDQLSLDKKQTIAGIYLSWDFFTGFSSDSEVKKNIASLNKTKEKQNQEKLLIAQNITDAYIYVQENYESFKISLVNLSLAKENLYLSQESYKNGLNDIYELNDSKLQFIQAKSSLVNIYYDYKISLSDLEFEVGNKLD